MTDFVKGCIEFHNPECFNDIFGVLKKACAKNSLGIKASQNGMLQFTVNAHDYILEATIQAQAYLTSPPGFVDTFTVHNNIEEIFTTDGEDIFKFIGKLKKGDTLEIQHIEPCNPNFEDTLMIKVNNFSKKYSICKGLTIDGFLAKDLLRDKYAKTTVTHFADPYKSRAKFGKHLKKIKSLADKSAHREFLSAMYICCDENYPEPRLLFTDAKYIASIHMPYMEKVPTRIVLNYKAADFLGNLLTHKMMKPSYTHLKPNIKGFESFMRFGGLGYSEERPHEPFGFIMREIDCRTSKDDNIESTAVFSFTVAEPLLIHFRFMARHTDIEYPETEKFFKLTQEDASFAAIIHASDFEKILDDRLGEYDVVKINVGENTVCLETKAAQTEIYHNGEFKAWPKTFAINNRLLRKILVTMGFEKPRNNLNDYIYVTLRDKHIYMATYRGDEIKELPCEIPNCIEIEAMPVISPEDAQ